MDQLIYIGAALAIGLLIGFVALAVIWLRKTMLRNVRSHTLNLLSAYDDLLEEKSKELAALEAELQRREAAAAVPQPQAAAPKAEPRQRMLTSGQILKASQRAAAAPYRDKTVAATYQQIREGFSFRLEEVLPLLEQQRRAKGAAQKLLEELEFDTVYRLSTLTGEQQLEVLRSTLDSQSLALVEDFARERSQFRILEFYNALQAQAGAETQSVRLYVPQTVSAGGQLGNVQVISDGTICEGFQAELGGKLYDYSINTRELS